MAEDDPHARCPPCRPVERAAVGGRDLVPDHDVTRYRLVRNVAMEKWALGHVEPFAPLYDVEEVDADRMPVRVIAIGVDAVLARAIIADVAGIEDGRG
jgi:hypothetical protein